MLGKVSLFDRVDSAQQQLTPSIEVRCVSFRPFQSFLWFAGCTGASAKPFRGRETDRHPRPRQAIAGGCRFKYPTTASQGCRGAADSDKSFIPCCAFPYGTGTYETSFIPGPPCSPFPVSKNYSLGRNL